MDSVPKGPHTVLVRQPGYQDWATSVQVTEGETAQVSATLVGSGAATGTAITMPSAATVVPTPTTTAPTPTRSGPAAGIALAGLALAGLRAIRRRP